MTTQARSGTHQSILQLHDLLFKFTLIVPFDVFMSYLVFPPPFWRRGPTRAMASSFIRFLDHTQNGAPQSVGLLWTNDQQDAVTST